MKHTSSSVGKQSLLAAVECPNVFVARTFSKAYGLAGLRMGALIGDADQMTAVRRVSSPYNVNQIALTCLPVALDDREYVQTYVSEILVSRQRLQDALRTAGISFWPSEANFVLLRVGATREDAQLFTDRMRTHGMLVRDRSADYGCEGCVRITLGPKDHTDRLLSALHETVEELGSRARGPPMRKASIHRITKETQIQASLDIDGRGKYEVSTGIRFFDHMLELFAHHGGFDLKLKAHGDLMSTNHTVEDVGIVLGRTLRQSAGQQTGNTARWIFPDANGRDDGNGRCRFLRTNLSGD